eukprot:9341132-Alexandrium_andersonii.AAC.1
MGPAFYMDGAAVPANLTGRNVLAQASQSPEMGTPSVAALVAGGAMESVAPREAWRCAKRGAPGAQCRHLRVLFSTDVKPWARTVRHVGPVGTAASSIWNAGPFSMLANKLSRCVL